jgi:hypothetical protein
MRWFSLSATTTVLLESMTATPVGRKKLAPAPVPSAKVPSPLPARVETTPRGDTSRRRWFSLSATTMTPLEATTATPAGELKRADVPEPSAKEPIVLVPPASVVTTPSFEMSFMRWHCQSATTITPSAVAATPSMVIKDADAPEPSEQPKLPPASVEAVPLFGGGASAPTVSAIAAAGGGAAPSVSPAAPHSSTAA